ncbi:uncharacterized protein B0I36DRAFT_356243 [Microdochium trichocladiopsis]|uniref:Uncharacterized protein n=1 Tax=Microdochium trichocladiopsis TaxID=1682393 RepID=A0A9P8XTP8_9PEZI|nr:uncharacterized protein B0I36DRAFT_356243 [Microdochium trichocladiopsis]KAH7012149.1 hypothetical protein B0I36DRAFT_356243 [Microdochium trichocladiopsis]
MAKCSPIKTEVDMRDGIRAGTLSSGSTPSGTPRLFSDFDPVPSDRRQRIEREHEKFPRGKRGKGSGPVSLAQGQIELYTLMRAPRNTTPDPDPDPDPDSKHKPDLLSTLPSEIRQIIYMFALRRVEWRIVDNDDFQHNDFPRGIGDPSGFYYPLRKASSVLRLNKQIREEALPLAFRLTKFCFDSPHSATMFLMAVVFRFDISKTAEAKTSSPS